MRRTFVQTLKLHASLSNFSCCKCQVEMIQITNIITLKVFRSIFLSKYLQNSAFRNSLSCYINFSKYIFLCILICVETFIFLALLKLLLRQLSLHETICCRIYLSWNLYAYFTDVYFFFISICSLLLNSCIVSFIIIQTKNIYVIDIRVAVWRFDRNAEIIQSN